MARLFFGILLIGIESVGTYGDGVEPYYGVQIGSFGNSKVYAADSRTLTIISDQKQEETGCTIFVGSVLDPSSSAAYRQSKTPQAQRVKRQGFALRDGKLVPQIQALNPNRHPLDWPFEFGHLKVEDGSDQSSSANSGSSGPKKIQDPFDVELSNDEDDDAQNATRPRVTVTPDPQSTVNVVHTQTSRSPVTRIRTVTAAIPDIEELPTSIAGPLLTLPQRASTPSSHRASTIHSSGTATATLALPTSTIPTIDLSSIVLHSSVNTEVDETNATDSSATTLPPAPSEGTTPNEEGSSPPEPAPIGDIDESAIENSESTVTPPAARKALWSRPTADPSGELEEADPFTGENEYERAANATAATSTHPQTSSTASPKAKGKKEKSKTTPSAKTRTVEEPGTRKANSRGDRPKAENSQGQWRRPAEPTEQASADGAPHSSGGIVWLGDGAPPAESQSTGDSGESANHATRYPPGRPGKKSSNRPVSVLRQLPVEYFGGVNVPDELEGKPGQNGTRAPGGSNGRGNGSGGDQSAYTIQFGGPRRTTQSPASQAQQREPDQQSFRGLPPSPPASPAASPPGTESGAEKAKPEAIPARNLTPDIMDTVGNESDCAGKTWCVVADPHRHRTRAPSATTTGPATPGGEGDGKWYVVDDRHAQMRGSTTPEPRKKREAISKISAKKPFQKVHKNPALLNANGSKRGNQVYLLPRFDGNRVTVRLPEAYQLTDFESVGVFDQCRKVRMASIKTSKIQAPKEVQLNGFRGWQYDVSASQVRILNCNSILFKGFTFSGAGKTEAYFFAGGGAYPFSVTKKVQAFVVGEAQNKPLKTYKRQDILVRLPVGVRTMDITWLAVLTARGASLAHVIVPPIVVPPCD